MLESMGTFLTAPKTGLTGKIFDWMCDKFSSDLQRTTKVIIGTGVTASVCLYIWRRREWQKRCKLPPGPIALPVVGNLFTFGFGGSDFHLQIQELRKTYGDIFTIWLGSSPVIVITSVNLAREAYLTNGNDYAGRPKTWSMEILTEGGKDILQGQFTPVWQLQRKIAHSGMRKYASGKVLEQLLLDVFKDVADAIEAMETEFDVMELMMILVYNIFNRMTLGKTFPLNDPFILTMRKNFQELAEVMENGLLQDSFPIFRFIETKGVKTMKKTFGSLRTYLEEGFEEHINKFDPENLKDLTDELIDQWKRAELEADQSVLSQFTKTHFTMILADVFIDGTDTTRMTLTFIIGYMCAYPEVQAKMQRELDNVLGPDGEVTFNKRNDLAYTQAVVFEVMRHMPIIPLGETHATTCDTRLGEYRLPEGTAVTLNVFGIHRDDGNFVKANVFNPDRWLDQGGHFISQPYSFLPFSMGRRVCVGESIAKVILHVLTAMLFHKFVFTPAHGQAVPPKANFVLGGLEPGPLLVNARKRNEKSV